MTTHILRTRWWGVPGITPLHRERVQYRTIEPTQELFTSNPPRPKSPQKAGPFFPEGLPETTLKLQNASQHGSVNKHRPMIQLHIAYKIAQQISIATEIPEGRYCITCHLHGVTATSRFGDCSPSARIFGGNSLQNRLLTYLI